MKDADDASELEGDEAKARRAVRANNFTQQTNALDVDKHMLKYIEDNMRARYGHADDDDDGAQKDEPWDPEAELYRVDPVFPSTSAQQAVAAAAAAKRKTNGGGGSAIAAAAKTPKKIVARAVKALA